MFRLLVKKKAFRHLAKLQNDSLTRISLAQPLAALQRKHLKPPSVMVWIQVKGRYTGKGDPRGGGGVRATSDQRASDQGCLTPNVASLLGK